MATVLRVKRLLSEDPANAIVVLSKRFKSSNEKDISYEESKKYFKFIGTVKDENEHIENEIISQACASHSDPSKYLIWREKNFRQDVKSRSQVNVAAKRRTEQREASQENRMKLVNRMRAVGIEDQALNDEIKEMYKLYDVIEDDTQQEIECGEKNRKDIITCNGVPLIALKPKDNTAYDLYYASDDFTAESFVENIVSIEKCSFEEDEDRRTMPEDDSSCSDGDDEDSNDENHWRNDYPEEDEDFEKEQDFYGDYDDDEDEILNMIQSCTMRSEDFCASDDNVDVTAKPTHLPVVRKSYAHCKTQMKKELGETSDTDSD